MPFGYFCEFRTCAAPLAPARPAEGVGVQG